MAAHSNFCLREGQVYQLNEYGLWVFQRKHPTDIAISSNCEKGYFVHPTRRPHVWYNDDFYFKLIEETDLEPYVRIGNHPNFPSIMDKWRIKTTEGDLFLIVMNKLEGESLEIAGMGIKTLEQQYRYYAMVHQTISAIEFAHSLNIVLFDVASYENVSLDKQRGLMYFIDLDRTALPIEDKLSIQDFGDYPAVIGHLLNLVFIDEMQEEGREEYDVDEDEDFIPNEHPDYMLRFCQQRLTMFPEVGPMKAALTILISKIEPFAGTKDLQMRAFVRQYL